MKIVKKALIILLSALMIFFISCSFDNGAGNVRNAPCAIRGEENVPQELRHLHDKVKAYIIETYGAKALEFVVFHSAKIIDEPINKYKGLPEFDYRIDVYGYGWGRIYFIFNADGEITLESGFNDERLVYCELLTKKKVERAAAKIIKDAGEPIEGEDFYFFIDDEKFLCIGTEIIVEFDETQPDGSITHDHKHVFYKERLALLIKALFDEKFPL